MKILFYNLAYGTGMDGSLLKYITSAWRFLWFSKKIFRKITVILKKTDPDILCLAEMDNGSFRNRFHSQANLFAKALNFPHVHTRNKYHPRSFWHFLPVFRKQCDAICSKNKGEIKTHYLKSGMKKLVQEYVISGLSIFTVHLAALSGRTRQKQLRELMNILEKCPRPYVLCGDFNINKGLKEIKAFIQKMQLRLALKKPTFPSSKPKWPLDLFLICPQVKVKKAGILAAKYSDHLPIWVELTTIKA